MGGRRIRATYLTVTVAGLLVGALLVRVLVILLPVRHAGSCVLVRIGAVGVGED
jgi:hypothetical protein